MLVRIDEGMHVDPTRIRFVYADTQTYEVVVEGDGFVHRRSYETRDPAMLRDDADKLAEWISSLSRPRRYKTIASKSLPDLTRQINSKLWWGWQLHGPTLRKGGQFIQPLVAIGPFRRQEGAAPEGVLEAAAEDDQELAAMAISAVPGPEVASSG